MCCGLLPKLCLALWVRSLYCNLFLWLLMLLCVSGWVFTVVCVSVCLSVWLVLHCSMCLSVWIRSLFISCWEAGACVPSPQGPIRTCVIASVPPSLFLPRYFNVSFPRYQGQSMFYPHFSVLPTIPPSLFLSGSSTLPCSTLSVPVVKRRRLLASVV